MTALLLCAGLGTRLSPVTNLVPKCLVPIDSKPLLEYWLENLSNAGVDRFIVNTHYKAKMVEEYVQSSKYKNNITIVHEDELLNTGGTLLACKEYLRDESFMLVHADNLSFCDFAEFIDKHKKSKYDITMMTFISDEPSSCGIVELNKDGVVVNFFEKVSNPPSNLANGAVYICKKEIFDFLESLGKKNIDFSLEVLPKFMGKIDTYLNSVYHRDIGTLKSYSLAQVEIQKLKSK